MSRGAVCVAILGALALAGPGAAHISVSPDQAVLRESTEFTITVPGEGGLATNAVRVFFPPQVSVYAVADAPGWTTGILRGPDGRLRGASWTGGSIPPDQYARFTVLGTPVEEGTSVWRSEQELANGQVKEWTGPPETGGAAAPETGPGEPGPSPAVEISSEPVQASSGGSAGSAGSGGTSAWPGVIGIALGALALVGVGLLWSSRPAELPPDGPADGEGR